MFSHDELKTGHSFNFAPMIDFLFLMLALFATLAVSRSVLFDTEVELAELKPERNSKERTRMEAKFHPVHLSITAEGKYKWLTEFQEYPMENAKAIQDELSRQYALGALPSEKEQTEVLLHIDRQAPWDTIATLLFSVREVGFTARPVYEPATDQEP
jgi:biopolymer transport protein ExbD